MPRRERERERELCFKPVPAPFPTYPPSYVCVIFIERAQIKHVHVDTFFNFYLFIYLPRSFLCGIYLKPAFGLCRIYWLARQIDFALFVCINAAPNLLKSIINNSTHTHTHTHIRRHVQRKRDRAMPNAPFYCSTRVVKNKYARCKKCRKNTVNQRNERATYRHSHIHTHTQQCKPAGA